jgi:hypothetical protein
MRRRMFCTKVVGLFLCVNFSYAQPKLKIYISADMEGVAGAPPVSNTSAFESS